MSYQLGIIGGVGSEASAYLYEKILRATSAKTDQEHLNMIILNHAEIADRTSYIMDSTKENPLPYFLDDIALLNNVGVQLILIPCNTSHYFYSEFQSASKAPIYHLIDNTISQLQQEGVKKVGILATDGTITSKLYQKSCEAKGIEWEIPSAMKQQFVMSMIYDDIKAGKPVCQEKLKAVIQEMEDRRVERMILACTELSMLKEREKLDDRFVDPLEIAVNYTLRMFQKTPVISTSK